MFDSIFSSWLAIACVLWACGTWSRSFDISTKSSWCERLSVLQEAAQGPGMASPDQASWPTCSRAPTYHIDSLLMGVTPEPTSL
ncbi:A disintegrin and metalloproteinase with thrombospondin motifs 17 [Grus japonensis]|uniref:A disintegrin and metalloproteinase with thrombospondin motifs 17 n=1 Tax=Grus japonensis TaxID=30415 RepID=A0ABC9XAY8_GRUJA